MYGRDVIVWLSVSKLAFPPPPVFLKSKSVRPLRFTGTAGWLACLDDLLHVNGTSDKIHTDAHKVGARGGKEKQKGGAQLGAGD